MASETLIGAYLTSATLDALATSGAPSGPAAHAYSTTTTGGDASNVSSTLSSSYDNHGRAEALAPAVAFLSDETVRTQAPSPLSSHGTGLSGRQGEATPESKAASPADQQTVPDIDPEPRRSRGAAMRDAGRSPVPARLSRGGGQAPPPARPHVITPTPHPMSLQAPVDATTETSHHRLVHPQGFRILNNASAVERSLRGYFRLPPTPNPQLLEERARLHQTLLRIERDELTQASRVTAAGGGVILDGFLLLSTAGCEDPAAVEAMTLQATLLVGTVPEDLEYFSSLVFLDVSENQLRLEGLLSLPALETLHLACNRIDSLEGLRRAAHAQQLHSARLAATGTWGVRSLMNDLVDRGEARPDGGGFAGSGLVGGSAAGSSSAAAAAAHDVLQPTLAALNLSYNMIPPMELSLLSYFPCLEKLDLSGNKLCELPADLSCLTSVTHLALEHNTFTSRCWPDIFLALSTMPSLVEVNLNHNKLSRVPRLSVNNGSGLCFPSIEVIGLSDNRFRAPDDVVALASLHRTLRRVVLSDNPISRDSRAVSQTIFAFQQCVVDTYWERTSRQSELSQAQQQQQQQQYGGHDNATAGDADNALWKEQSWSRLIPRREEDQMNATSGAATYDPSRTLDIAAAALAAARSAAAFNERPRSAGSAPGDGLRRGSSSSTARPGASSLYPESAGPTARSGSGPDTLHAAASGSLRDFYPTVDDYFAAYQVSITFHDAPMPKRDTRFFYASQAGPGSRTGLVTLPEYGEFMDIYRLTGKTKAQVARHRRPVVVSGGKAGSRTGAVRTGLFPSSAQQSLAPPSAGSRTSSARMSASCVSDEAEESVARAGAAFFMTELGDDFTGDVPVGKSRGISGSKGRAPSPAQDTHAAALPPVVSPAVFGNGNVHSAMNELKSLLRRPLLPLAYGSNSQFPGTAAPTRGRRRV